MSSKHFQICAVANGPFEAQPITEELYNKVKEENVSDLDFIGEGNLNGKEVSYYQFAGDLIHIEVPEPITVEELLEGNVRELYKW